MGFSAKIEKKALSRAGRSMGGKKSIKLALPPESSGATTGAPKHFSLYFGIPRAGDLGERGRAFAEV